MDMGEIVGDRYEVLQNLSHGGMGKTYLAADLNRFREQCLLKEFAPQATAPQVITKTAELFEREAAVLYRLNHPQIPRFRELLKLPQESGLRLVLVLDYVPGKTYRQLLHSRIQQGTTFQETEIWALFQQLLPVLDYIHGLGVIHRDISPDNLIFRADDMRPVLIDFGGVKEMAAHLLSATGTLGPSTCIGKPGYAPQEQMQRGEVSPSGDLYSLGATAIALLTGQAPSTLINPQTLQWDWSAFVTLSPPFTAILQRLLAPHPPDRFQQASAVLQAMESLGFPQKSPEKTPETQTQKATAPTQPLAIAETSPQHPTQPPTVSPTAAPVPEITPAATKATLVIAPGDPEPITGLPTAAPPPPLPEVPNSPPTAITQLPTPAGDFPWFVKALLVAIALGTTITLGWLFGSGVVRRLQFDPNPGADGATREEPVAGFSEDERQRKQQILEQRQALGLDGVFFNGLVNQQFWQKYPSQKNKTLTSGPADLPWREKWDQEAIAFLTVFEQWPVSVRRGLGQYDRNDVQEWVRQGKELRLGSAALSDLTDGIFFRDFPSQRGQSPLGAPWQQLWYGQMAIALQGLQRGTNYQVLTLTPGRDTILTGTLPPGMGQAYVFALQKGDRFSVNLRGGDRLKLSFYSPTGKNDLLMDSREDFWSGTLPETGFYEITLVADPDQGANFNLRLRAE